MRRRRALSKGSKTTERKQMPGLAFRDIKYREREEGEIGAEVVCAFHDKLA